MLPKVEFCSTWMLHYPHQRALLTATHVEPQRPLIGGGEVAVHEPRPKRGRPAGQRGPALNWSAADVVSAIAAGLAARSPGAPQLLCKLLLLLRLLRPGAAEAAQEPLAATWLRAQLTGPPSGAAASTPGA